VTEADLMEAIRRICQLLGIRAFHVADSRRSWGSGFPDLVMVGTRGVIYRECKGREGVLRPDQRAWGSALAAAGGDWAVWRPADLQSGVIYKQLEAIK
jgi:VRR-NUC domain-containing protein